jgi:organic radical activating enzyme
MGAKFRWGIALNNAMPRCNALFNQRYIDIDLRHQPCCKFDIDSTPVFKIKDMSVNGYKNLDWFKNLKSQMETGWHPGCHQCEDDEKNDIVSLRQDYNKVFSGKEDSLECIDIAISNECNVTCKMCSNRYSSKWASVHEKSPIPELLFPENPVNPTKINIEDLFKDVDLSNLTQVKYLGGEPFITPEIYELVEFLEENNICHQITFKTNTNLTYFPKKLIEKLKKFKELELGLSIDGIDGLCNFIRTGSKWSTVSSVVDEWMNIKKEFAVPRFYLHHTAQAYNLHQFNEVKNFAKSKNLHFHYSILHYPGYLSYAALPKEYIQELVDNGKLTDEKLISSAMGSKFNKEWFEKLKIITKKTDAVLNTDIEAVIPELAKYLK